MLVMPRSPWRGQREYSCAVARRGLHVGSPEYVACRKDRDVQRNNANAKADRAQRNLGEYMLNHPDHP